MTSTTTAPGEQTTAPTARTYDVRTFGCQMNVHDSERLSGLLEDAGYAPLGGRRRSATAPTSSSSTPARCARTPTTSCTATSATSRRKKRSRPGMQIAVGGCLAQKDRDTIVRKAPWVDVVFGTHNIGSLPALLDRARHNEEAQVEILEALEVFPSTLPTKRDSAAAGWVSISVGCNNTCTFCIVPSLRGKEKDRRPGEILAEVQALVDDGAIEVTLLGQNVNTYGVEFGDRGAFAKLLRACGHDRRPGAGAVHQPAPGRVHRRRHRRHGRDPERDAAAAHAAAVGLGPRCCARCAAPTGPSSFLGILDTRPRRGSRRRDLHRHHRRASRARPRRTSRRPSTSSRPPGSPNAFTFQYSIRPGTPAASLPDQLPKAVVQERYVRLVALQEQISWDENQAQLGRRLEVLVAPGEGRKDGATARLSGRARDNRLVHFTVPPGAAAAPSRRRRRGRGVVRRAAPPGRRRRPRTRCAAPGPATRGTAGRPSRAACHAAGSAGGGVVLGLPTPCVRALTDRAAVRT